ncbi:hypothetical protein EC912_101382 [Luteibacter rhizovicinus]|uniref:Uncharacterized protein n=1 Tax=Luteibacter rhizovicinus TaxID=242606 RepID=A0A4R3Z0W4_9GAMM|nr:hypothetical protein [Luteibacter rhizovicinus]TCV97373.1 hypothetical protein EC912_101382 [Luteibacter rhizovicinus]
MATKTPFPEAGFLRRLEAFCEVAPTLVDPSLPPLLARHVSTTDGTEQWEPTEAGASLVHVLRAYDATLQAAFDTELVADELRRYQRFARPGQPSASIIQLRQKQAVARLASSRAKQALLQAEVGFVRAAGINVPPRKGLEAFMLEWISRHVPKDLVAPETSQDA